MNANIRANEFDFLVGQLQIREALLYASGRNALDVGCGPGHYLPYLAPHFEQLVLIDKDQANVNQAQEHAKAFPHVCVVQSSGEDFHEGHFDTIFLTNVLEHVDWPVTLLHNLGQLLQLDGRLIVQVPNGRALNRLLGFYMGLTPCPEYLSLQEQTQYGHQRVYTAATLNDDICAADLVIEKMDGVVLKPLTNAQMNGLGLPMKELVEALYELGKSHVQWCANLLAVVRRAS